MLTLDDLTITRDEKSEESAAVWEQVETPDGRKFLVGSCDYGPLKDAVELAMTGADVERPEGFTDEDIFAFMMGWSPVKETWVMEATVDELGEWIPANECGPHCETGVCNKRLASDENVASQERGYAMLLNALNA